MSFGGGEGQISYNDNEESSEEDDESIDYEKDEDT